MRYFVTLSFDGTAYHGWQTQPNGISVQEVVSKALSTLLRAETAVVGAGRTDAGVHARMMVAHFDCTEAVDCQDLAYRLNRLLPQDISVSEVRAVSDDCHARFSAVSRTYRYYVHTRKDPFVRSSSCLVLYPLNFSLMNEAASLLLDCEDFAAFCKSHNDAKTTLCHVTAATWRCMDDSHWYFEISANRFLRNMVRAVVGTLIEVGRGRMTIDEFREVMAGGNRCDAGESMPAHALFLEKIEY